MIPFYEHDHPYLRVFYSDNFSFPLHLHSQVELLYVLSGSLEIGLQNKSQLLKAGDFALFFPNQIHTYQSNQGANQILIAIADLALCGDFLNMLTKSYCDHPFLSSNQVHVDIPHAMESLYKEFQGTQNTLVYKAFIQLILARVSPLLELSKIQHRTGSSLTYEIAQYISKNYTEDLSLDHLASHLCISKYHISHVFSEKIGSSLTDYINSFRLSHALHLLKTTQSSMSEISELSGFPSQRTFNRVFKDQYHTSPSQYREGILP